MCESLRGMRDGNVMLRHSRAKLTLSDNRVCLDDISFGELTSPSLVLLSRVCIDAMLVGIFNGNTERNFQCGVFESSPCFKPLLTSLMQVHWVGMYERAVAAAI